MDSSVTPERILQLGLGFWGTKTLLSAVELGLFTVLAEGPQEGAELAERLCLHPRSWRDFLDALVALGMLRRDGDGRYANTPETGTFLDRSQPGYIGGMLEMANARLYGFWGSLSEALRTGQPQNEEKTGGANLFDALYAHPNHLRGFLQAMSGASLGPARAIAAKFPWERYQCFADIGTAQGCLPAQLTLAHEHLTGIGFDLPPVAPVFEAYVGQLGLSGRLRFQGGNFFHDALPEADVLVMGHILHDWDLEQKKTLLSAALRALPRGGALVVYDAIIDDTRSTNAFGLLMSLNMLIETHGGFDYTGADCIGWMREVGFREARLEHLAGPDSMVIGTK
ncbi:methyltransferase [Vitiosangium sp. GDMCC 1.1324]|uniref:methyltransferase n=1 Tax=Vitiosangium sp. (strain GDMCC 1.1324) TaxID=2138576 RepID=UPI000D381F43|nr:methyltransferase [Vitiosangium sp. GDMCC 1.1324]PTL84099.1 methyltransferase [Vitiosangium sp. GDMCC 1.1324]